MAKPKPRPGEVLETVTQQRIVTADAVADGESEGTSDDMPRDIFDFMEAVPEAERDNYHVLVHRVTGKGNTEYIAKWMIPFDEDYLKASAGGGEYRLMLKRGSEIRRRKIVLIAGEPKSNVQPATPNPVGIRSDLIQVLELLQKTSPQAAQIEMLKTGFTNALEVQKQGAVAATTANTLGIKDLIELADKMSHRNESAAPAWLAKIGEALVPLAVGLLGQILAPKDAISEITKAVGAMNAIKSAGTGNGTTKVDYLAELIRNGPGLLSEGSKLLAEMRAATQLKIQTDVLRTVGTGPAARVPAAIPVVTNAPVQPAPPAPSAVATTVPNPQPSADAEAGRPAAEWVLNRIVDLILHGDSGEFVVNFIDSMDAAFVEQMKLASPEQLKEYILAHPVLSRVKDYPRLDEFLKEMQEALHPADERPPLPN